MGSHTGQCADRAPAGGGWPLPPDLAPKYGVILRINLQLWILTRQFDHVDHIDYGIVDLVDRDWWSCSRKRVHGGLFGGEKQNEHGSSSSFSTYDPLLRSRL